MGEASAFRERLAAIVGARHIVGPDGDLGPYVTDRRERYRGRAEAAVEPGSVDEVAAIVRLAAEHGVTVVPQGVTPGCAVPRPRCSPAATSSCASTGCGRSAT
jgi:hypothetical protein